MPESQGWIIPAALLIGVAALATEGNWKGPDTGGPPPPPPPTQGSINVTVVDSVTGAVVPGQQVVIVALGLSSITGANGAVLFQNLNPGTYNVQVAGTGAYQGATVQGPATVTAGLITSITLPLVKGTAGGPMGTIVVTVTDGATGAPLSGQLVSLGPFQQGNISTSTGTNGKATLVNIIPGQYTIFVRGQGGYGAGSDLQLPVFVIGGSTTQVSAQLFNSAGG